MKITEIQDLIKFVAKSGVNEVEIEQKDFKICIKTEGKKKKQEQITAVMPQQMPVYQQPVAQAPAPAPVASAPAAEPATPSAPAASEEDNYITIKSPMIGTFYRKSSPDKPAFVEVGDDIKSGDVICIVEAMKLFNEIEAEVSGKVVKVLIDDNSPVEYDQPLFLVDPS